MEVSQCSGKRSAYLKGRCNVCKCTEQRSNANTQDYLKQHKPLEELSPAAEVQQEDTSTQLEPQLVQPEVPNETPKDDKEPQGVSSLVCAGIGAFIGLTLGKAVIVLKAV
jgi:hypothetical protein